MIPDEPDLALLKRMVAAPIWREAGHDPTAANRLAAACALAWLAGAHVREIARMTVEDWRPDGRRVVRIRRADDIPDRVVPAARAREIPILAPLRRAMEARLADMPGAAPTALLLAGEAPWDGDPRGWLDICAGAYIKEVSSGRLPSLAELSSRFREYAYWLPPSEDVAQWLAGRIHRRVVVYVPTERELRQRLREMHPIVQHGGKRD